VSRAALPAEAIGLPATTYAETGRGPLAMLRVPALGRRPVLLVPGFTGSKEDFGPLLPILAAAGHPALALDQRGQFESPGPDDPAAYTVAALAADLLELIDNLRLAPVHLVGHSFGGLVSRAAVASRPAAFRSLVLLDSGPAGITGRREGSTRLLGQAAATPELTLEAIWDAILAYYAHEGTPPPPDDAAAFQRRRFTATTRAALVGMAEALLTEPDRVDELAASGVPVLVACGEADDAWLPEVQTAMAHRLGAPCVVIPDAAHSPAVENTAALAGSLLDWLARRED
jgi:pimeloyl-ACP methyl ester carboxylesterase